MPRGSTAAGRCCPWSESSTAVSATAEAAPGPAGRRRCAGSVPAGGPTCGSTSRDHFWRWRTGSSSVRSAPAAGPHAATDARAYLVDSQGIPRDITWAAGAERVCAAQPRDLRCRYDVATRHASLLPGAHLPSGAVLLQSADEGTVWARVGGLAPHLLVDRRPVLEKSVDLAARRGDRQRDRRGSPCRPRGEDVGRVHRRRRRHVARPGPQCGTEPDPDRRRGLDGDARRRPAGGHGAGRSR